MKNSSRSIDVRPVVSFKHVSIGFNCDSEAVLVGFVLEWSRWVVAAIVDDDGVVCGKCLCVPRRECKRGRYVLTYKSMQVEHRAEGKLAAC